MDQLINVAAYSDLDADWDGKVDIGAGGTDQDFSGYTGVLRVSGGECYANASMDHVREGATYGRVLNTHISSGKPIKLAESGGKDLTVVLGASNRILTLGANVSLDQNLRQADSPTFAGTYVGNVHLEDDDGCLATSEFHAHGKDGVSSYFKLKQGTTPTAHKEADHSILWVDSNDVLYLEKADGTDCQIIKDDGSGKVGVGILHIKANVPGTVGSHPAGQLIIQDPDDSVFGNAVITGYESDSAGNPDQQLWYLGSSSSSNTDIEFRNRRNASLSFGTNDTTRMTIAANGDVTFTGNIDTVGVYKVDTVQVVKEQQVHIVNAPGDTAANNATTINQILAMLEAHGLIANS